MKKFVVPALVLLLVSVGSAHEKIAVDPKLYGDDWRVEQAGRTPYLVQNGVPAFGRFVSNRPRFDLGGDWEISFGGENHPPMEGWEKITVPGVWNYLHPDKLNYIGVAWYRRTFKLPEGFDEKTIRLYFGGVNMRCRVWLNGIELGGHEGGYTPFAFDATKAIDYKGENLLLVMVDNRMTYKSVPPLNYDDSRMGWWEYGGIHREVYLEAVPEVATFKLYVTTAPRENGRWAVWATALFWDQRQNSGPDGVEVNGSVVRVNDSSSVEMRKAETFIGPNGVWGVTFVGDLDNPILWSPEAPGIPYVFSIDLKVGDKSEHAETGFGVRKFEARPDGLFLNGKPYYIRGINRHEDTPEAGLTETDFTIQRDISLLKELHVNHIRPAHYPPDPKFIDATDRAGIGVTEEIPLYQAGMGWTIYFRDRYQRGQKVSGMRLADAGPGQFENPQLSRNATLNLIEMIERDINHPSVLAWSIGNENWTFSRHSRETYQKLRDTAKLFDPDRPVTFALLTIPFVSTSFEETGDLADFLSVNEYFGWYHGKVSDLKPYLEKVHKRYPNKPIVVSEFGAESLLDPTKWRTSRKGGQGSFRPDDHSRIITEQWEVLKSLPFVWGGMPWLLADFRCGWFKEEHPKPYFNSKGVVTYEREKKPTFAVLQAIYADLEKNPPPLRNSR